MSKINLGVIFGGQSTEHDISTRSGMSVVEHLDNEKYNIFPIYIDNEGTWYEYKETKNTGEDEEISIKIYSKAKIKNIITYLKEMDVVFPVMHGLYGEDGTIQGLLELLQIPYVGCGVLASSIGMDKIYTKIVLGKAGIRQARYCYVKKIQDEYIYVEDEFSETKMEIMELLD